MATKTRRRILAVVIPAVLLLIGIAVGVVVGAGIVPPSTPRPPAASDDLVAWVSRVLLVLAIAWIVIGMLAARTRLVRRPGAAAARATWLGSTRPWRARESTLGMLPLDWTLLLVIPAGLLVSTRAAQTSLASWTHVAIVLGTWIVFLLVARLLLGPGRSPYPLIAAVGGVVVLRSAETLATLAVAGPGNFWTAFWSMPFLRVAYIAVAFALYAWLFVAAGWAVSIQVGVRRAAGVVLAGIGATVAVTGGLTAVVGLDTALTVWSDELGLVPWTLSRLFGPDAAAAAASGLAWVVCAAGVVVLVVGALLARPRPGIPR